MVKIVKLGSESEDDGDDVPLNNMVAKKKCCLEMELTFWKASIEEM